MIYMQLIVDLVEPDLKGNNQITPLQTAEGCELEHGISCWIYSPDDGFEKERSFATEISLMDNLYRSTLQSFVI